MRRGGRLQAVAASPTLVGAVTALIIVVAIFLAYNANNGLPFVTVYRVSAEINNGARLTNSNEVRIGGNRVGSVESVETFRRPDGSAAAKLNLKLDKKVEELPTDTQVRIRYKSAFGLKYVELQRGSAKNGIPEGGTIPISQSQEQEEFDDVYDTFNAPTRANARKNLVGFGDGFAARGSSINQAVSSLDPLFRNLLPVTRNLAAPGTQLGRFVIELADAARITAPVAAQQSQLFTNMADTFDAFSSDPEALKDTISGAVSALEVGTESLRVQRPFLADFAALSGELRPGVRALRRTLPVLNDALAIGTPVLRRSPAANRDLGRVFASLEKLVELPATKSAISRLADGIRDTNPLVQYVAPFQTVCNAIGYDFTYLANHLDEEDAVGLAQRQFVIGNSEEIVEHQGPLTGYSGISANGRSARNGEFDPEGIPVAHGSAYGPAVDAEGNADCQNGQTGYLLGDLRVPGQPPSVPAIGVSNFPGLRGPTFPDVSGRVVTKRP